MIRRSITAREPTSRSAGCLQKPATDRHGIAGHCLPASAIGVHLLGSAGTPAWHPIKGNGTAELRHIRRLCVNLVQIYTEMSDLGPQNDVRIWKPCAPILPGPLRLLMDEGGDEPVRGHVDAVPLATADDGAVDRVHFSLVTSLD